MYNLLFFLLDVFISLSVGAQVEATSGAVWGIGAAIGTFFGLILLGAILNDLTDTPSGLWG